MKIDKDWQIETDNMNVIVQKRRKRTSKDGTKYDSWENLGYFSRLDDAAKFLIAQKVRDSGLKDLNKLVDQISELEKKIEKALSASQGRIGGK